MHAEVMCKAPDCEEIVDQRRFELGYKTCIYCGSPPAKFTVAIAYNKGPYAVISQSNIKDIGK